MIDFNEYFEDIIGVTIPNDLVENIILKIDRTLVPYITTKPLHGSQKIKEIDNNFEVHLKSVTSYFLTQR